MQLPLIIHLLKQGILAHICPCVWILISCIQIYLIYLTLMIFWGFKVIYMCCRVNCLLSTFSPSNHAILRPSCSALSVYLSIALHCGIWRHLICVLWKLPSIILLYYWEKFRSFLVSVILISFTVLAVSKVCTMLINQKKFKKNL